MNYDYFGPVLSISNGKFDKRCYGISGMDKVLVANAHIKPYTMQRSKQARRPPQQAGNGESDG